ncbi:hypothetical protein [Stenotrophomonas nematodicola]|uniref:Uncharacterized protein n=1 Tax=Stenotrophomonas nematodicola TaxID=2656746 RepID=A0ABW7CXV2_9GAMM
MRRSILQVPAPGACRAAASLLIVAALAACSSTQRLDDAQVRPMDRPECQVGSQRRDLDAGVPVLIGGTGCRGNPDASQPLNKRPANAVELGKQHD